MPAQSSHIETGTYEAWRAEMDRSVQRIQNLTELATGSNEPVVGQSPRVEVYRKHKARLYYYEGRQTHRTPVLFVPNLGISRPYIFDLMPGSSFIEYMCKQGSRFISWTGASSDLRMTISRLPTARRAFCRAWGRSYFSIPV